MGTTALTQSAFRKTVTALDNSDVQLDVYFTYDIDNVLNIRITCDPLLEADLVNLHRLLERDLWDWSRRRHRIFELDGRLERTNTLPYSFDGQRCPELGVAFGAILKRFLSENAFSLNVLSGAESSTPCPTRRSPPKYGDILLPNRNQTWQYSVDTTTNGGRAGTLSATFSTTEDGWLAMSIDCSSTALEEEVALVVEFFYSHLWCNHDGQLYTLLDRHFVLYDPTPGSERVTPKCGRDFQTLLSNFVADRQHELNISVVQVVAS